MQIPDLGPLPLPPAPAGHRWRVDPNLCGRAFGQGLQRGGELYADLPRGAGVWRVLLGSPVTEPDLSGEGLLLLASDGRSYSPGKARWLVDEMMGRIAGHRSWLATWTRYSGIWARRFAIGVEAGWLREVGESERDEAGGVHLSTRAADVIIEHIDTVTDDVLPYFMISEEDR